jgi:hypothetical protein
VCVCVCVCARARVRACTRNSDGVASTEKTTFTERENHLNISNLFKLNGAQRGEGGVRFR